jgi:hypothetical protein
MKKIFQYCKDEEEFLKKESKLVNHKGMVFKLTSQNWIPEENATMHSIFILDLMGENGEQDCSP